MTRKIYYGLPMVKQSPKHKVAVFDKKGTLVSVKSQTKFINSPEDQILIPGVVDRLKYIQDNGYRLVIACNQGGVKTNKKTLSDTILEMRCCIELLANADISIDLAMFCPDHEGKICYIIDPASEQYQRLDENTENNAFDCLYDIKLLSGQYRKPHGGMLKLVSQPGDTSRIMIGNQPKDQSASLMANFDDFIDAKQWHQGRIIFV
jgi:D-glycero-D-manno-heptose 1,7-bisphosphate phosphatase